MKSSVDKFYFCKNLTDATTGSANRAAQTHETAQNLYERIDITLGNMSDAVKRDWLFILALQTTFNVHYFFYVVLELVTNSLPY
jgi:hypothetical protein